MKSFVLVQYCINLEARYLSAQALPTMRLGIRVYIRHRGFRDLNARPVQIFPQTRIEFVQASELEVRHRLLLILHISLRPDLVGGGHDIGGLE